MFKELKEKFETLEERIAAIERVVFKNLAVFQIQKDPITYLTFKTPETFMKLLEQADEVYNTNDKIVNKIEDDYGNVVYDVNAKENVGWVRLY